jgi:uncharacterized membrane protein
MSLIGWLHLISALAAVGFGAAVLMTPKGTQRHRRWGYLFLVSMLALNAAALSLYRIDGSWTGFHWLALASLLTLAVGILTVRLRRPASIWLPLHGGFMAGAYVGLLAAGTAQIATYVAPLSLTTVLVAGAVTLVGTLLIVKYLPGATRNTRN